MHIFGLMMLKKMEMPSFDLLCIMAMKKTKTLIVFRF